MPVTGNITLGKMAAASDYVRPYEPYRAVDGSFDKCSRWLCASQGACRLSVDLRGYYKVTSWSITSIGYAKWDNSCNLNSFKIQGNTGFVSNPQWFDIDSVSNNTNNTVGNTFQTPVAVNALRVYVTAGDSRAISKIASIMDFTANGYPVSYNANLSQGKSKRKQSGRRDSNSNLHDRSDSSCDPACTKCKC